MTFSNACLGPPLELGAIFPSLVARPHSFLDVGSGFLGLVPRIDMDEKRHCVLLTSKQVQGLGGGEVDPGRASPGVHVGAALGHPPPLAGLVLVAETQLAVLTHEARTAQTALLVLHQRTAPNEKASLISCSDERFELEVRLNLLGK